MQNTNLLKNEKNNRINILLTGAIRVNTVFAPYNNEKLRRTEYLSAIKYYSNYGFVHFIENSGYDFESDSEFMSLGNVKFYPMQTSSSFFKGKGYQEFEMIDDWFQDCGKDLFSFIKITGRYKIKNFNRILKNLNKIDNFDLYIERSVINPAVAHTDFFLVKSKFYENYIYNLWRNANDSAGIYIENVMAKLVAGLPNVRVFPVIPQKSGVSGSTGKKLSPYHTNLLLTFINMVFSNFYTKKRLF